MPSLIIICEVVFFASILGIFWAMVWYPIALNILGKLYRHRHNIKDYTYRPNITVMVVAHNEESVILDKLNNLVKLRYPKRKLRFVIASDNSTDNTNKIVRDFISNHKNMDIRIFNTKKRMGKTNAQNEAFLIVRGQILIMTDANSILKENAITELTASFSSPDISYVTGRLVYINKESSTTSKSETVYWDLDLSMREIESRIQTITAGNGALYACRVSDYVHIRPIESHDSAFPVIFALQSKRCIFNPDAIAYEKASIEVSDEFKRKIRMNRLLLAHMMPDIRILNIAKYKWFTVFYLSHRSSRYSLWLNHTLALVTNAILANQSGVYCIIFVLQLIGYFMIIIGMLFRNSGRLQYLRHYGLTIAAQYVGVFNIWTGRARPFWESSESSR